MPQEILHWLRKDHKNFVNWTFDLFFPQVVYFRYCLHYVHYVTEYIMYKIEEEKKKKKPCKGIIRLFFFFFNEHV